MQHCSHWVQPCDPLSTALWAISMHIPSNRVLLALTLLRSTFFWGTLHLTRFTCCYLAPLAHLVVPCQLLVGLLQHAVQHALHLTLVSR